MDLGLRRNQLGQDAAEPERVLAELRSHPVVTAGRRVALVEDQVDDLEHRRQTGREIVSARQLEGDPGLGERALGADDPLGDGRLRDEERARDLLGGQPSEQAQREGNPRLDGENRMAGDEHQAQEIIADVVVDRLVEVRRGDFSLDLHLATDLLVLALEPLVAAQEVDGTMLRGGHEPGARIVRNARPRPPLEGGHQGLLRDLLGEADVAHHPRQPGDEPGRLDPPDCVDGALWFGSRQGGRSQQVLPPTQGRRCARRYRRCVSIFLRS